MISAKRIPLHTKKTQYWPATSLVSRWGPIIWLLDRPFVECQGPFDSEAEVRAAIKIIQKNNFFLKNQKNTDATYGYGEADIRPVRGIVVTDPKGRRWLKKRGKKRRNPLPGKDQAQTIAALLREGLKLRDIASEYGITADQLDRVINEFAEIFPDIYFVGYDKHYKSGKLNRDNIESKRQAGLRRYRQKQASSKRQIKAKKIAQILKDGPKKLSNKLKSNSLKQVAKFYKLPPKDVEEIFLEWAHSYPKLFVNHFLNEGHQLFTTAEIMPGYVGIDALFLDTLPGAKKMFAKSRKYISPVWLKQGLKEKIFRGPSFIYEKQPAWSEYDLANLDSELLSLWIGNPELFPTLPATDEELETLAYWWNLEEKDERGRLIKVSIDDVLDSIDTPLTKAEFKDLRQSFPYVFEERSPGRYIKYKNPL